MKRAIFLRLLSTMSVLTSLAIVASVKPASAEQVGDIQNFNSGKCLGVTASGFGDSVWANQYTCYGAVSQHWSLQETSYGAFRIINDNSGRCLDVMGGTSATGSGVHVHQFLCLSTTQTNQIWRLRLVATIPGSSSAWYQIVAAHSNLCLSVDSSYLGNMDAPTNPPGLGMNQWQCLAYPGGPGGQNPAQVWKLAKPPTTMTATECPLRSHVQRLALQPGDAGATGMTSTVKKTLYAFPGCSTPGVSRFVAQPGAHLGLGTNGTAGIIETGFYIRQLSDGGQENSVFSEYLITGNNFNAYAKRENGLDFILHGTPCGRWPSNNLADAATFSVALYGTVWYTTNNCSSGVMAAFNSGGYGVGRPAFEFEMKDYEGLRAGGVEFARQWGVTYTGAGGATRAPAGVACYSAVPNLIGYWNSGIWQVLESEGTVASCSP